MRIVPTRRKKTEFDGVRLKRSSLPMNSVCVTVRGHECAVVKLICFVLSVDFVKEPKCLWSGLILMETALQLLAGYHRPPSAAI
jgi:hypothetical protein